MSGSWGPSYIKLDEKHRLILPARVRPALADGTHLTWGQDNCLFLFSESQFEAHREHNRANPPPGMPPIAFDRIFYSSVVSQAMD
ncbi:MAG: hypothetical protein LBK95_07555, partial [Bifidobacteriaceae bacterium]|nr:hypothetical protein [Bifidobacteriaceae bacterium]